MNNVILVKANKGGVGKSWITLQIAHALALKGKKVLIITSDSQNDIPRFAGIKDLKFEKGLEHWIKYSTGNTLILRENLYYIPLADTFIPDENIKGLKNVVEALRERLDYIFIDSTPVLNLDDAFLELADQIIIPTFLDSVTSKNIRSLLEKLELKKVKAIIPNRATRCKIEKEYLDALVSSLNGTEIVVACPINQSAVISRLIEAGKTLFDDLKPASEKFRKIFLEVLEVIEWMI